MRNQEIVTERHVQAIWYDGRLRPKALRSNRGVEVRVVDPGSWNLEAGPDFRNAVLEIAGKRLVGDVEVHLHPGDWLRHGHSRDPAYRAVILHVTWFGGVAEELPSGCLSLCVGDFLRTQADFSPEEIDLGAYPYAKLPSTPRPCEEYFANDVDGLLEIVAAAGRRRLEIKARRIGARFVGSSREQVFYEEVLAALGYKYNAFPFRNVAKAMPWNDLPSDPEAAATCFECVAGMKVTGEVPWHLANVRPANSPAKRLKAAARLFAQGPRIIDRLKECDFSSRSGLRAAVEILREDGIMGPGRAGAVLANAVMPFMLATGVVGAVPEWLPPEDVSAPVRLTAFRLLGRDHNPALYSGNGLFIQGLIQIHREYCLAAHPDCQNCGLLG